MATLDLERLKKACADREDGDNVHRARATCVLADAAPQLIREIELLTKLLGGLADGEMRVVPVEKRERSK